MSAREDQARFFGKLAALLQAEVPLLRAMEVALEGVRGAELRDALLRITDRAYQGISLGESFREEAAVFGSEVLTLIGVGEEGGDLEGKTAAIARGLGSDVFDVGREGSGSGDDEGLARLVRQGVDGGATAIHIEPVEEGARIRIRTEEGLREIAAVSAGRFERILGRCRRRLGVSADAPDGPVTADFDVDGRRVRLSLSPYEEGPGVVIHLPAVEREVPGLEQLGLTDRQADAVRGWLAKPSGIVLVAGPAGGDRDLVVAAVLSEVDRERRKTIITGRPGGVLLPDTLRFRSDAEKPIADREALANQGAEVIGCFSAAEWGIFDEALLVVGCSGEDAASAVAQAANRLWPSDWAPFLVGCLAVRVLPRHAGEAADAPFPERVAVFETLTVPPGARNAVLTEDKRNDSLDVAIAEGLISFEEAGAALVAEGVIAAEDLA